MFMLLKQQIIIIIKAACSIERAFALLHLHLPAPTSLSHCPQTTTVTVPMHSFNFDSFLPMLLLVLLYHHYLVPMCVIILIF